MVMKVVLVVVKRKMVVVKRNSGERGSDCGGDSGRGNSTSVVLVV